MKLEDITRIAAQIDTLECKTAAQVEEARIRLLGKKGEITALFDEFRTIDKAEKAQFGKPLNELKQKALAKIEELKESASEGPSDDAPKQDLSMPGD